MKSTQENSVYSESQIQDRLVYPHRHEPMASGVPSSKLRPFRPMDVRATPRSGVCHQKGSL